MIPTIVQEFREGLAAGKLLIQKCSDCAKLNMYPRYACPFCQSKNLGWQEASGKGILHSYTVLRMGAPEGFEEDLPYALAVVKLDEGVQMLTRLEPDSNGDWESYRCDMPVKFSPKDKASAEARPCAWFAPN